MKKEKQPKEKKTKIKKKKPVNFHRYLFIFIFRILMCCYGIFFPIAFFLILSYDTNYKDLYEICYTFAFRNHVNTKWMNYSYYGAIAIAGSVASLMVLSMYVLKFNSPRDAAKTKKLALNLIITPIIFIGLTFGLWALFAYLFKGSTPDWKGSWSDLIGGYVQSIHQSYKIDSPLFIWLVSTEGVLVIFGIWTFIEFAWLKKNKITFNKVVKTKKNEISFFEKVIDNELEFGVDFDAKSLKEQDDETEEINESVNEDEVFAKAIKKLLKQSKKSSPEELTLIDRQEINNSISYLERKNREHGNKKSSKVILKQMDDLKKLSTKVALAQEDLNKVDIDYY